MTNEERQQIANICRAHDEFMIEHADWMARREAQASPPVEKSGDGAGLIFRTTETERAPAAAAVSTQSSEAEDYPVGRDEVARALGVIIAELRAEGRKNSRSARAALLGWKDKSRCWSRCSGRNQVYPRWVNPTSSSFPAASC